MVLVFFGGNLDLRKCKFLTDVLFKSGADFVQFSAVWGFCMKKQTIFTSPCSQDVNVAFVRTDLVLCTN